MTYSEYKKEKQALENDYKSRLHDLYKKFAIANDNINIGDIISVPNQSLIVEEKRVTLDYDGTPIMNYYGTLCTQSGKPRKMYFNQSNFLQTNIRKVNGKPYVYAGKN